MRVLRYLAALAFIGLAWQAGSELLGPRVLPAPALVLKALAHEMKTAEFWGHVRASFGRAGGGVLIGFLLAWPLGIFLGAARRIDAWLSPLIFLTYPIPKILFLPILLVLLGLGEAPKIVLIILTVGYQVLVVTRDSVRSLDSSYLHSFQAIVPQGQGLMGRSLSLTRHLLLPASFPAAVSSLRIAAGTAVAVLFMAESFVTDRGLGFMIMDAWGGMDLPRMFSGIMAMSLLGFLFYEGCNILEHFFCRWTKAR